MREGLEAEAGEREPTISVLAQFRRLDMLMDKAWMERQL